MATDNQPPSNESIGGLSTHFRGHLPRWLTTLAQPINKVAQLITGASAPLRRLLPARVWTGMLIVSLASVLVALQNYNANSMLHTARRSDVSGHYVLAQKELGAISQFGVWPSIRKAVRVEQQRNQQLAVIARKLAEAQQLLKAHKLQAAKDLLQSISRSSGNTSSNIQTQIAQLQKSTQNQTNSTSSSHGNAGSSPKSGSGGSSGGGSSGGGSGGSGGGSGGGSPPPPSPGPLTSLSIVSFTANASPATASTCNISDSVTFSANGSGSVTTTWSLLSSKTTSQIDNPYTFNFSAAGSQNDSFGFGGTQGLEPGDSYRVSVTVTSVSNPSISTTAGPIYLSTCAAPPALAAEQEPPIMTMITPGTPSVYESQDSLFTNSCSVQVTTPYSVNAAGTVEAIVMMTSSDSIGYTYYDRNGATGFTAPGSTNDTSYFRLPHLPGGGHYSIVVKLVEVSSPNTVHATTSPISSVCD